MKKVERFVRRYWWILILAAGFVFSILWKILGPKDAPLDDEVKVPTFVERARDKIERVHLEGDVDKAKIRAVADEDQKVIAAIEKKGETDPKGAREDIAKWLASNL